MENFPYQYGDFSSLWLEDFWEGRTHGNSREPVVEIILVIYLVYGGCERLFKKTFSLLTSSWEMSTNFTPDR
jgi:hypothetical protein